MDFVNVIPLDFWINLFIIGFLVNLFLFVISKTYRQMVIGALGGDIGFYECF